MVRSQSSGGNHGLVDIAREIKSFNYSRGAGTAAQPLEKRTKTHTECYP